MTSPRITMLMNVFNGGDYLAEAVESVLAQTMDNLELLVVDDCSTDDSWQILESYAARDARVRLLRNAQNMGPYPSANRGLEHARAPLIARLDGDDIAEPNMLERQLAFMDRHSDCVLVGGGYRSISADGALRYERENGMDFDTCAFVARLRMPMIHCYCFRARFSGAPPVRYDENVPIAGDYALACKLANMGRAASLPGYLIQYRMHATNITTTKLERQRHFAHGIASDAIAAHYPADIARGLRALVDVHYRQIPASSELLKQAIAGLESAIGYDLAGKRNPEMRERAAGILAETFAAQIPLEFTIKAAGWLPDVIKRYARLKGWVKPRPFGLSER